MVMSFIKKFSIASAASLGIMASTSSTAQAEPTITITHPPSVKMMGGQEQRTVDCDTLFRFPSQPKKLWLTCDFAQQVDSNNQKSCNDTDTMPSNEAAQKHAVSQALYKSLIHFARVHKDCVAQAGTLDSKLGKDADALYGKGWQDKNSCKLVEAKNACQKALGLD